MSFATMSSGMWFAVLKPNQPLTKKVKYGVTITQAVLDTENAKEDSITRVVVNMDNKNLIVANLSLKHSLLQSSLNLIFEQGDTIKMSVASGSSAVHLFGYTTIEEEDMMEAAAMRYGAHPANAAGDDSDDSDDDEEEEDEEDDDEEELEAVQPASGKRKRKSNHPLLDKSFPSDDESDNSYMPTEKDLKNDSCHQDMSLLHGEEDLPSEDDDDDYEDVEDEEMGQTDSDDEEEDDDDEDEEDDDEDEEVVTPQPSKKMKMMNGHAEQMVQSEQQKKHKKEVKDKTPQKAVATPPQKKKNEQPKSAKAQKKEKFDNKENQSTPKQDKKKQKGEKSPGAKPNEGSAKKTPKKMLSGGVVAEDLTVGNGALVKNGSMVSVYYEGRLKNTNALFDKNLSGPPFKFRVGRGEVIKGWDVGVSGMKVGGKRKIIVPPSMGYGKQGAPPSIPGNAPLSFEVTVLSSH